MDVPHSIPQIPLPHRADQAPLQCHMPPGMPERRRTHNVWYTAPMSECGREIGILGGSFDPVHEGHLALARTARETFGLDEVRLMPCARQALKERRPASAEDRCAMLRLALAREPGLTLDCRELFRGGRTHTYDTLSELRAELPGARLWFILGMDSVRDFARWHRARELLGLCAFIAFDRPGVPPPERPFDARLLEHRLRGPLMGVSSSDVRRAVAARDAIRYPMGDLEERYLKGRHLYSKESLSQ